MVELRINDSDLRSLLVKFYGANDPVKLQQGIDINGIVDWTLKNGEDKLEQMLMKQYGKQLESDANETFIQKFNHLSFNLTPQLFPNRQPVANNVKKMEKRIRRRLEEFYPKHDKTRLDPGNKAQFDRIVKFGVTHGIEKLNIKLLRRYKAGIIQGDDDEYDEDVSDDEDDQIYTSNYLVDKSTLDMARFKDDLEEYFRERLNASAAEEVPEEVQYLDLFSDWILRMGFSDWNNKSEQVYGKSFDDVLISLGREPYAEETRRRLEEERMRNNEEARRQLEIESAQRKILGKLSNTNMGDSQEVVIRDINASTESLSIDQILERRNPKIANLKEIEKTNRSSMALSTRMLNIFKNSKYIDPVTGKPIKKSHEEKRMTRQILAEKGRKLRGEAFRIFLKKRKVTVGERKGSFTFLPDGDLPDQSTSINKKAQETMNRNKAGQTKLLGFLDGDQLQANIFENCDDYKFNIETGLCKTCNNPKMHHTTRAKKLVVNTDLVDRQSLFNAVGAPVVPNIKKIYDKSGNEIKISSNAPRVAPGDEQRKEPKLRISSRDKDNELEVPPVMDEEDEASIGNLSI